MGSCEAKLLQMAEASHNTKVSLSAAPKLFPEASDDLDIPAHLLGSGFVRINSSDNKSTSYFLSWRSKMD
jgi:hypothetical protein